VYEDVELDEGDAGIGSIEKQLRGIERAGVRYAEKVGYNVSNKLSYLADDMDAAGKKSLAKEIRGIVSLVKTAIHADPKKGYWDSVRKRFKAVSNKYQNEDVELNEGKDRLSKYGEVYRKAMPDGKSTIVVRGIFRARAGDEYHVRVLARSGHGSEETDRKNVLFKDDVPLEGGYQEYDAGGDPKKALKIAVKLAEKWLKSSSGRRKIATVKNEAVEIDESKNVVWFRKQAERMHQKGASDKEILVALVKLGATKDQADFYLSRAKLQREDVEMDEALEEWEYRLYSGDKLFKKGKASLRDIYKMWGKKRGLHLQVHRAGTHSGLAVFRPHDKGEVDYSSFEKIVMSKKYGK